MVSLAALRGAFWQIELSNSEMNLCLVALRRESLLCVPVGWGRVSTGPILGPLHPAAAMLLRPSLKTKYL